MSQEIQARVQPPIPEDIDSHSWRLGALSMAARQYLIFGEESDRLRLISLVNAEFPYLPELREE